MVRASAKKQNVDVYRRCYSPMNGIIANVKLVHRDFDLNVQGQNCVTGRSNTKKMRNITFVGVDDCDVCNPMTSSCVLYSVTWTQILNISVLNTVRASEKIHHMRFIYIDICHRLEIIV